MFNLTRHSIHRLRLWLIAAAAILLITSVLEAGHVHGIFAEADAHCTLCQQSVALDKFLSNDIYVVAPLLLSLFTLTLHTRITSRGCIHFALIRAPPIALHRC